MAEVFEIFPSVSKVEPSRILWRLGKIETYHCLFVTETVGEAHLIKWADIDDRLTLLRLPT